MSTNLIMILKDILKIVIPALLVAFIVNNFIVINVSIPTASMETTLQVNDRMFANRLAYIFGGPKRGDIVVFNKPNDDTLFVKRIIGLPGEKIGIHNGEVYIDDKILENQYSEILSNVDFETVVIPDNQYFMLGDNRNNSKDSRFWSFIYIDESEIIGKAAIKYFPTLELFGGK